MQASHDIRWPLLPPTPVPPTPQSQPASSITTWNLPFNLSSEIYCDNLTSTLFIHFPWNIHHVIYLDLKIQGAKSGFQPGTSKPLSLLEFETWWLRPPSHHGRFLQTVIIITLLDLLMSESNTWLTKLTKNQVTYSNIDDGNTILVTFNYWQCKEKKHLFFFFFYNRTRENVKAKYVKSLIFNTTEVKHSFPVEIEHFIASRVR